MRRNVGIIGCGYVGLAYIALLSKKHHVVAYDVDQKKLAAYQQGEFNLAEKILVNELLKNRKNIEYKFFGQDVDFNNLEMVFVAVPTNYDEEKHQLDVSILNDVISKITQVNPNILIVIKSTIPFGYTDEIIKITKNQNIVFMPEFLREGKSFGDTKNPSRVILGCDEKIKVRAMQALIAVGIITKKHKFIQMSAKEAESVKLFANTYLAMRVAFFNELDNFALQNRLDCKNIIDGVCMDNRIGNVYNNPSFGFGGYCLEKDTKQCAELFTKNVLIHHIIDSNNTRKQLMLSQILQKLKSVQQFKKNAKQTVGILNLAFKANSDNHRNSPMLSLIQGLHANNVNVVVFDEKLTDPQIMDCNVIKDFNTFIKTADVIVANRFDQRIKGVTNVFTRDIFSED